MVISSCAPLCRSLVPILGIELWGVGLRWDDDARKSRIMCLWCECRCLKRMKGLSRGWGWAGVAYVLRSEAPQLLLLLLPCLLVLPDEFHVRCHHIVIFILLHIRLAFLLCLPFEILFYVGIVQVVLVFYVDTINVAIPEQMCCVCPMRLYQLFSALFALKFYC